MVVEIGRITSWYQVNALFFWRHKKKHTKYIQVYRLIYHQESECKSGT